MISLTLALVSAYVLIIIGGILSGREISWKLNTILLMLYGTAGFIFGWIAEK